jgi:hypothetical protein
MLFEDKMYQLCINLFKGTNQGSIQWTETAEDDSFRALLKNAIVRVERHQDPYVTVGSATVPITTGPGFDLPRDYKGFEGFIYSLVVFDDRNKQIARFVPSREEKAVQLRNLWELAFHSARKSEQKTDSLLHELEHLVVKSK